MPRITEPVDRPSPSWLANLGEGLYWLAGLVGGSGVIGGFLASRTTGIDGVTAFSVAVFAAWLLAALVTAAITVGLGAQLRATAWLVEQRKTDAARPV